MTKKRAEGEKSSNRRTSVKDLPVSAKELTAGEKKKVKGGTGIPAPLFTVTLPVGTAAAPLVTAQSKTGPTGAILDSELSLIKK